MIVYISIGNSDDKLSQADWARYFSITARVVQGLASEVYGQWVSEPASAWQNACWCVAVDDAEEVVNVHGETVRRVDWLKVRLAEIAADHRQDSIAWAEAPVTEFIGPGGAPKAAEAPETER